MGPPPTWSHAQEAETVDGTELSLHLAAGLEQPGARRREHDSGKGPGGGLSACVLKTHPYNPPDFILWVRVT